MPELNVGATVQEIREAYEAEKTQLVMRCFDIAIEAAKQVELPLNEGTKGNLNQKSLQQVYMAQAQDYAAGLRDEIKTRYAELDAEMEVAINARAQIIESELLAPSEVNPSDLIAAAQMAEDAILSAIEVAIDLGEAAEDTLLLLFKVARENDQDGAIARVMSVREDIADLMGELAEAQQVPELNADVAFETYAAEALSGRDILNARQSDINIVSRF